MRLKLLNKSELQFIAMLAMVVDHMSFLAADINVYCFCRIIGKITIIVMSYFVAEGYYKTHDVYKYISRMAVFAAISQIPFRLFQMGNDLPGDLLHVFTGFYFSRNVIFTLLVALCLLTVLKQEKSIWLKVLAIAASLYLVRNSDWRYFAVMWVVAFGLLHGDHKKQMGAAALILIFRFFMCILPVIAAFMAYYLPHTRPVMMIIKTMVFLNPAEPTKFLVYMSLTQLGGFLAIPILSLYNGEKGTAPRFGLYIFYPAHLLVLFFVKLYMGY